MFPISMACTIDTACILAHVCRAARIRAGVRSSDAARVVEAGDAMSPIMIGVFEQYANGRRAFEELVRQGFSLGELGLVANDANLVDQVAMLATADVADRGLCDVLVGMGV